MPRVRAAVAALLLSLTLGVMPAGAGGPPQHEFFMAEPVEFAPGDVCEFGVLAEPIRSRGHQITFPEDDDGTVRQRITGKFFVRLTNTSTGASVARNMTGPVDYWYHADGTITSLNRGHSVAYLFFFEEGGPALWFQKGPVLWSVTADGLWSVVSQRGVSEDLCATLAD
jgi:hypothetical protein